MGSGAAFLLPFGTGGGLSFFIFIFLFSHASKRYDPWFHVKKHTQNTDEVGETKTRPGVGSVLSWRYEEGFPRPQGTRFPRADFWDGVDPPRQALCGLLPFHLSSLVGHTHTRKKS